LRTAVSRLGSSGKAARLVDRTVSCRECEKDPVKIAAGRVAGKGAHGRKRWDDLHLLQIRCSIRPVTALPALFAACSVVLAASCTSSTPNVLHVYTSLDAQEAPVYIDAFERESGVQVEWVRLSAGEALARLEAERRNPQVSVWFGGPSPEYVVAAQRGLLEPFQPLLEHTLDAAAHGAGWEWTGFYFGVIGFACNEPFLQQHSVQCPTSWAGLLTPSFRGQISLAYPYTSGTAYVVVAALLSLMGEEQGWDYLRRLDAQVHHYNSSGSAAVTQVGLGEVAVGIAFSHDILGKGRARGYPIALSIPREGTPSEIGAVAVVKGGPEPELAKQFVTWLVSERAQNLLAQFYRVPLHPKAQIAEGAVTARDVRLVEYDPVRAATEQKQILARWREITGR
jgi:iron(III) transport system substrate-binding protein